MTPIDDELRRALERHAGDVPPLRDPVSGAESRARRMQRRRAAAAGLTTVVAAVAIALVVPQMRAGDGKPGEVFTPAPVTPAPATSTSASSSAPAVTSTSPSPPPQGPAVAVYYVGDTGRRAALYREFRKTRLASPERVEAALALMLSGPLDGDYTTSWPAGTKVVAVTTDGDLATVDFNAAALTGQAGSEHACMALQQLVWTVTATDTSIKRVAVSVEGRTAGTVSTWWGVGCGPDEPMTRHSPSYEVLAPVQISSHNDGDTIRGNRFTFGGEATVFEATVSWSVVDSTGNTLLEGFDTATEGAPGRGSWQANVVLPGVKAGHQVQLRAWESSAKDGSVQNLDTKTVTIGR